MDARIEVFYRQYLQQVAPEELSFPPGNVMLEPTIQYQMCHFMFEPNPSELSMAFAIYQKRVLKEVTRRIEAAIRDPNEDEISNTLMEKMARFSTLEYPLLPEAAQEPSAVIYSLPYTTRPTNADAVLIEERRSLLASGGTTGFRTWDACLHLATYLATEAKHLVFGKSVLELGAGTGLLSIICGGPLSAAYVLATDGARDVQQTMKRNILANSQFAREPGGQIPIEARVLEWGPSAPLGSIFPSKGGSVLYDTILGADIIYDPDSLDLLASTLSSLAELCPTANIVIAATIRNEATFNIFLARCQEHGLSVHEIEFRCPPFKLQKGLFHRLDPPICIVRIKKEGRIFMPATGI